MLGWSGVNLAPTVPNVVLSGRPRRWMGWLRLHWARSALAFVGLVQTAIAIAQTAGVDFGMVATHHGTMSGAHLLNESTAWTFALGAGMVIAAAWPPTAAGLTCVLAVFTAILSCYVVSDGLSGQVTDVRLVSHLPVVVATVLAFLVWRRGGPDHTSSKASLDGDKGGIVLPDNATRGRRRGHLWPTDNSAA
jgi:predicted anti-sigma-YlaC factor YlaD